MRGAEGLRARTMHSVLEGIDPDGNAEIWLPFATDADISCERFTLSVRSELPEACRISAVFTAHRPFTGTLLIYRPDGIAECDLELRAGESRTAEIAAELQQSRVRTADGKRFKYMRGDLILAGNANGIDDGFTGTLAPLTNMYKLSVDAAGRDRRTVLFPDTAE